MTVQPMPGDFGLVKTGGQGFAGLVAWAIRFGTDAPVNHAFVYVGDGRIVEAEPGGACESSVDRYGDVVWSTGRLDVELTTTQRWAIVQAALDAVGTPYGWLDIVAIALAQKRLGGLVDSDDWIARRISNDGTLICSQLVDVAYKAAGVGLFADGRLPGLVSPGDLYRLLVPAARPAQLAP
jgi:uncharacterized protein YycO